MTHTLNQVEVKAKEGGSENKVTKPHHFRLTLGYNHMGRNL
jgi:hypothetical protein